LSELWTQGTLSEKEQILLRMQEMWEAPKFTDQYGDAWKSVAISLPVYRHAFAEHYHEEFLRKGTSTSAGT
jgi:hypothetical protein